MHDGIDCRRDKSGNLGHGAVKPRFAGYDEVAHQNPRCILQGNIRTGRRAADKRVAFHDVWRTAVGHRDRVRVRRARGRENVVDDHRGHEISKVRSRSITVVGQRGTAKHVVACRDHAESRAAHRAFQREHGDVAVDLRVAGARRGALSFFGCRIDLHDDDHADQADEHRRQNFRQTHAAHEMRASKHLVRALSHDWPQLM